MSERYNGWTNYETWNAKLWIDNSEGDQCYWQEQAQDCYDDATADDLFTRKERAALDLADRLKQSFDAEAEVFTGNQASFFADIFNAALGSVNWHEIAASMLEEVEGTEEEPAVD